MAQPTIQAQKLQQFETEAFTLDDAPVQKASTPEALTAWVKSLTESNANRTTRFQTERRPSISGLGIFGRLGQKKTAQAVAVDHLHPILYRHADKLALIVSDGKQHYFYDLIQGKSISSHEKEALGNGWVDVSGTQLVKRYEEAYAHDARNGFTALLSETQQRLDKDLHEVVRYAASQIASVATPAPTERRELGRRS